jgi:medium-chain acyl-[acyl-carrier-protein] hydrolase
MGSWLLRQAPKFSPTLRLFCLPFAGVGPSAFRGWSQDLPADIEAVCVHLPGRESRLREASVPDVTALANGIAGAIEPLSSEPFALLGHSLGGLIAFEVARALRQRALPLPVTLFVSACRAPHLPYPFPPLRGLDDLELLQCLNERYDGSVPREVLESPELRALLVPALRADLAALETYRHQDQPALECPITAFGGTDDLTLTNEALQDWRLHTSQAFRHRSVRGGHFYLQSARRQVIDAICEDLLADRALESSTSVA